MQEPMLPLGGTSVMARRADHTPDGLDYFPTPPWAARAGGELIAELDPGRWSCWEPAAGGGHMAHGLIDYFDTVMLSDVHNHSDGDMAVMDFLGDKAAGMKGRVDWVVTNPPFKLGEAFVRRALMVARRGVAMLLRLAFVESVGRYPLFYGDSPLTVAAPFAERVPMVEGRWDPDASSATAYCWFIWIKGHAGPPMLRGIPPGARERLSRPEDIARFIGVAEAPLFAGDAA